MHICAIYKYICVCAMTHICTTQISTTHQASDAKKAAEKEKKRLVAEAKKQKEIEKKTAEQVCVGVCVCVCVRVSVRLYEKDNSERLIHMEYMCERV